MVHDVAAIETVLRLQMKSNIFDNFDHISIIAPDLAQMHF